MTVCKHKHIELDGICLGCGLTEEWRTIDSLKEEVKDLKERLSAARFALGWSDGTHGIGYCEDSTCKVCSGYRATDLRVKNWRKP